MTAEAAIPDPALIALSMKSLVLDLPLAIAAEATRFNARIAVAWFDHLSRIAALNGSSEPRALLEPDNGPTVNVAPTSPYAVAAKLAA
ncbi:hypothetical protein METY_1029 [Methylopila sp. Yamaguchi]|nr:hypothetical protein METY_1029 [Methylopila sp. Yamaguchi]